jgi:hypothetical protein
MVSVVEDRTVRRLLSAPYAELILWRGEKEACSLERQ